MELGKTIAAILLNTGVAVLEIWVLQRLVCKKDILKYYTYLSNLIAMIGSAVFAAVALRNLICGDSMPIWLKGLRFAGTYMLVTTMFVFSFVLLPGHKSTDLITADDFTGIRPEFANLVLHYLCPVISAFSFILLERQPMLTGSEWTLYAAVPTLAYWSVYLLLTACNLWKDPYGFSEPSEKPTTIGSIFAGILMFLLIPALSMGLDYLLWWLNTLNF